MLPFLPVSLCNIPFCAKMLDIEKHNNADKKISLVNVFMINNLKNDYFFY